MLCDMAVAGLVDFSLTCCMQWGESLEVKVSFVVRVVLIYFVIIAFISLSSLS